MSIAIIIATHGKAARPLLETTEMLIGEQQNIAALEFLPGENSETLAVKFRQQLMQLETSQGVLFLVDTWGGTPFNAASLVAQGQENYQVIAGINVSMLAETLMYRDDNPSLAELTHCALEAGREAVRALNETPVAATAPEPERQTGSATSPHPTPSDHLSIALARIDDRLIHGQVATRWTKETGVKRIIVVSSQVAADPVRKTLLTQVAPPGVTAHVVDVAKMIRVYNNPKYAGERVMLLFTNPTEVLQLVESGVAISSVNIGGMAYQQGKSMVTNAVSLDSEDIAAFNELHKRGIELEVRKVASDPRVNMLDLMKKIA